MNCSIGLDIYWVEFLSTDLVSVVGPKETSDSFGNEKHKRSAQEPVEFVFLRSHKVALVLNSTVR